MAVRIMIDCETLGVSAGCTILSIGACRFDGGVVDSNCFHHVISRSSCRQAGLIEDPATLSWWATQDHDAQETLRLASTDDGSEPLGYVLTEFSGWLLGHALPPQKTEVWGNGADFDLPILGAAFIVCGFGGPPWRPYAGRCYRTLKNLRPDIKMVRNGQAHNALADALNQAKHAIELLGLLGFAP